MLRSVFLCTADYQLTHSGQHGKTFILIHAASSCINMDVYSVLVRLLCDQLSYFFSYRRFTKKMEANDEYLKQLIHALSPDVERELRNTWKCLLKGTVVTGGCTLVCGAFFGPVGFAVGE